MGALAPLVRPGEHWGASPKAAPPTWRPEQRVGLVLDELCCLVEDVPSSFASRDRGGAAVALPTLRLLRLRRRRRLCISCRQ